MSFSKAKSKRFNEDTSCAPPVGSYDPQFSEKVPVPLIASGDERFKDLKVGEHSSLTSCNSSSSSNLCPAATSSSFVASTPKKFDIRYISSESLAINANQQCGESKDVKRSRLPRKIIAPSSIIPPAEFSKIRDLEKQIRSLVQDQNELRKRLELKEDEMSKMESRLHTMLKERTAMGANMASLERDIADLRKSNDTMKTKMIGSDCTTERVKQLQCEVNQLQDVIKKRDREIKDLNDKYQSKLETIEAEVERSKLKNQELSADHLKSMEALQTSLSSTLETNKELYEKCAKLSADSEQLHSCMKQERDTFEMEKESFQNTITQQQAEIQIARLELAKIEFSKSEIEVAMSYAQQDMEQARKTVAQMESELSDSRKLHSEAKASIILLREEVEQLKGADKKHSELSNELLELTNCKKSLEYELASACKNVDELKTENRNLTMYIDFVKDESLKFHKDHQAAMQDMSDKVDSLENELSITKMSAKDSQELEDKVNKFKIKAEISHVEVQQLRNIEQELRDTMLTMSSKLQEVINCKEAVELELLSVQKSFDELKTDHEFVEKNYVLLQDEKEVLTKNLESTVKDASDKISSLETELGLAKKYADDSQTCIRELEDKVKEFDAKAEISLAEVQRLANIEQELRDTMLTMSSKLQEVVNCKEAVEFELLSVQKSFDELKTDHDIVKKYYVSLQNEKEVLTKNLESTVKDASDKISSLETELGLAKKYADDSQTCIRELEDKVKEFDAKAEISLAEVQRLANIEQELRDTMLTMSSKLQEVVNCKEAVEFELLSVQKSFDELKTDHDNVKKDYVSLQDEKEVLKKKLESTVKDTSDKISSLEMELCLAKKYADDSQTCIRELEDKVKEFDAKAEISLAEVQRLANIEQELRDTMLTMSSKLQEVVNCKEAAEFELLSVQKSFDELKTDHDNVKKDYVSLQDENEGLKNNLESTVKDTSDKISSLETELGLAKKYADDSQTCIRELEDKVNEFKIKAEISHMEVQKLRNIEKEQCVKILTMSSELQELTKCKEAVDCKLLSVQSYFEELKTDHESVKKDYVSLQNEKEVLSKNLESAVKDTSDKISSLETELGIAKKYADDYQACIRELEEKVNEFKSKLEISRVEVQKLRNIEQEQRDKIVTLSRELQEMVECKETLQSSLVRASESLQQLRGETEFLQSDVDVLVSEKKEHIKEMSALTCKLTSLEKEAAQKDTKVTALEKINGELENMLEVRDQDLYVLQAEIDRLEKKIIDGDAEKSNLQAKHAKELSAFSDIVEQKQVLIDTLSEQSTQSHSELEGLRLQLAKEQHKNDVAPLTDELHRWRSMYNELWERIQPFKDQLAAFDVEKQILLGKSKNAEREIENLSADYAKLLGHQNNKQKIHHVLKLKEENITLKQEVQSLRDQQLKDKRQLAKYAERVDALEGKKLDTSRAFLATSKENEVTPVLPLKQGNRK